MPHFRKRSMEELERKSDLAYSASNKFPLVLVLDGIRSLNNVGSIFRTADAFSLQSIVLCGVTGTPPHREIQKTALGATESVDWEYTEDIVSKLTELKSNGFCIVAIEQTHHSTPLEQGLTARQLPIALILGNEISGVSDAALQLCDHVLEIPQFGSKHSLNVAVSAGIVIWELVANQLKSDGAATHPAAG